MSCVSHVDTQSVFFHRNLGTETEAQFMWWERVGSPSPRPDSCHVLSPWTWLEGRCSTHLICCPASCYESAMRGNHITAIMETTSGLLSSLTGSLCCWGNILINTFNVTTFGTFPHARSRDPSDRERLHLEHSHNNSSVFRVSQVDLIRNILL